MPTQAEEVLHFWFTQTPFEQRFSRDARLDNRIRQGFGLLHKKLSRKVPPEWRADPRAVLAAVIVLDQFSRNLYRDDARAYDNDGEARALAYEAIAKGWDHKLSVEERYFLYIPFMHSEDLADQERSVELFRELGLDEGVDFAIRHRNQIKRFGRFPQRNSVMGRETSIEEQVFLERPDARF